MEDTWENIFNNTFEAKPLEYTEWEQIVLKLIDGELEIVEQDRYVIDFNYNKNLYTIWLRNPDISQSFGTLWRVNGEEVSRAIQNKTQIRPEIQAKLKVFAKITDKDILEEFEKKHFKL